MALVLCRLEKKIAQTHVKIEKMERDKETKEDLKTVALGTSKINYLDPRITVAWCKRHEVPIEKVSSCFQHFDLANSFRMSFFLNNGGFLYRFLTSLYWRNLPGQWMLIQLSDSNIYGSSVSTLQFAEKERERERDVRSKAETDC